VDGIQKRLTHALDPDRLRQRVLELLTPDPVGPSLELLEARLQETDRQLARLVDALAAGPEDLPTVRRAVAALERERVRLEAQVVEARAAVRPAGRQSLQATVDGLLEALSRVGEILAAGTTEQRRAVVRSFLAGIRIDKATRRAILRWHRLPRGLSVKLVELRGAELDPSAATEEESLPIPPSRRPRQPGD